MLEPLKLSQAMNLSVATAFICVLVMICSAHVFASISVGKTKTEFSFVMFFKIVS